MTVERKLTIREAYSEASSFLEKHRVMEAANCAQLLLEHVLGVSRSELLLKWREMFPVEHWREWNNLLERKAAGEPVQYITGEQEFYGLPFTVSPAVLIPRPETELLVEQVVETGRLLWPQACGSAQTQSGGAAGEEAEQGKEMEPLIADIGAGSGAIAVSLAVLCPKWRLLSSDISPAALTVAKANAERHGVSGRIGFFEGDLLQPYIDRALPLDAVVSNPPYIPDADEEGLQPEVRLFEPRSALYGGADGLVLYRRLIAQLPELPRMPSLVGLEVGQGQADAVAGLLREAAEWDEVRIIPDLAGIDRHVVAVKHTS